MSGQTPLQSPPTYVRDVADGLNRAPGQINGLATLGATGTLTESEIPASIANGLTFQAVWNATTNSPTLPPVSTPSAGDFWICTTAGATALPGAPGPWTVGQCPVFNGTDWDVLTMYPLSLGLPVAGASSGWVLYVDGSGLLQTAAAGSTSGIQAYSAALAAIAANGTPTAWGLARMLDANQAANQAALGLGTAAYISATAGGDLSGSLPSPTVAKLGGVTPSAFTLTLIDEVDAPAWQAALGLGSAATQASSAFQAADAALTAIVNAGTVTVGDVLAAPAGTPAWSSLSEAGIQPANATLSAVAGGTYTGDDSITTVGTIGTGTWHGTAIERAYNGYAVVSSASNPTVNDDSGDGYAVGQVWVNTTTDVPFMLADASVGAAVWRSLLRVDSYEIRLTAGAWTAYPQAWTGSAWVDVGAGVALTVETAGSFTTSGTTFTIPSGLTNSTQPHTSQYMAYIALSSLSIWSASADATYRVEMSETSMATDSDCARWGWALAFPTGAYDSSAETLLGGRYGRNTGSAVWTWTSAAGTGTWTSVYSNAAVATYRHVAFMSGVARGMTYATGGATVDSALAPPTTAATHLYVLGAGSGVTTASVAVVDPRIRITRLSGAP